MDIDEHKFGNGLRSDGNALAEIENEIEDEGALDLDLRNELMKVIPPTVIPMAEPEMTKPPRVSIKLKNLGDEEPEIIRIKEEERLQSDLGNQSNFIKSSRQEHMQTEAV
jgi:hypothetical protein